MKRIGTLALAVILITGCNAMKPNLEETELLSKEIEKRIYAQAWPTEAPTIKESKPTPAPIIVREQEDEAPPAHSVPAEEPLPTASVSADRSEEIPLQSEEPAIIIDWPYITCPPEPEWPYITAPEPPPASEDWPYITAPEPPTYTPAPELIEPPQEPPSPTPQPTPAAPAVPIDPIPEPTEQPAEQPSGGYAQCSCGARLTPDELIPHMKAHAMSGESHSYVAY